MRDCPLLLVKETRALAAALQRIQHEPRFDLRAAKAVGDGFGASIDQEIAKGLILAPEIERGIFVLDGAEAAALAQQESLEVEFGNGVPQLTAPLGAITDVGDIVVRGQPMSIVSDDHDLFPLL